MLWKRKMDARELGRAGERRAAWFYRLRGYRIVAKNLRLACGEIDLVVRRGATVVVAEVKTRQSLTAGEGHSAVDRGKQSRLIRLGEQYLRSMQDDRVALRYDVLSLFWNGRRFVVSHFADAFRPTSDAQRPWRWRT